MSTYSPDTEIASMPCRRQGIVIHRSSSPALQPNGISGAAAVRNAGTGAGVTRNHAGGTDMQKCRQRDRRCNTGRQQFPCLDSSGEVVQRDRRRQPERRLSAIEAEWQEMADESGHAQFPVSSRWGPG
jgi:hypothetical protein